MLNELDFNIDMLLEKIPSDLYNRAIKYAEEKEITLRLLILMALKNEIEFEKGRYV